MNRSSAAVSVLCALMLVAPMLVAAPREVATARQLANQGIDAFEAGDCDRALELLGRAQALHSAPVHLQYMARCYKKQGKWVLATESWRKILRDVKEDAPPAFRSAAEEAKRELPEGVAQLGSVVVRVTPAQGARVLLDGKELPAATLGVVQVLDPGKHEVVATAPGYARGSQSFEVQPKGKAEVSLVLERSEGEPTPSPGDEESSSAAASAGVSTRGPSSLGIALTAAGGAAVIGGAVTLLLRNGKRSDLQDDCPNDECRFGSESEFRDRKATVENLTTVTNVLFIAGGALAATGVTLLVLGNGEETKPGAEVAVLPTPNAAALHLSGRF